MTVMRALRWSRASDPSRGSFHRMHVEPRVRGCVWARRRLRSHDSGRDAFFWMHFGCPHSTSPRGCGRARVYRATVEKG